MSVKKGFTLAEVLITLSIIGVVAALTIPSLVRKYERQEWITRYKATFNIVSQASKMVAANNGGSIIGAWDMSIVDQTADMYRAFLPYLKVTKKVENENLAENKCFSAKFDDLAGKSYKSYYYSENGYCVVLSNGASLLFNSFGDYACIDIDLNGIKGPNVLGKDYHVLWVYDIEEDIESVVPVCTGDFPEEVLEENCPSNLYAKTDGGVAPPGVLCGARILRGDYALDY